MKKVLALLSVFTCVMQMAAVEITSPDGNLLLNVDIDPEGIPVYNLDYKGKPIIKKSKLGVKAEEVAFTDGFKITGVDTATVDRTWQPVWGEYSNVRDHFRELAVHLESQNPRRAMTVRFRVFDDGIGFRYELPIIRLWLTAMKPHALQVSAELIPTGLPRNQPEVASLNQWVAILRHTHVFCRLPV